MKYKSSNRGDRTRYPLPIPIDDGSRICVKVYVPNIPGHRQAFQGAIYNLTRWYSWTLEPTKQAKLAADVWSPIYDEMMETFYDGCPDDNPCFEFTPAAQFIEWFPNNPYSQPDLVTAGYNSPAWYEANAASNLILGTQYGDIVTDLTRFPPGSLPTIIPASGLPRFRLNLTGEGRVTINLLNILAGSLAQITVDDEFGSVRFIDSNRDQLAVPFETATTTPVIIDIVGAGAHHIDVIIVSQLNDQIPFLHHGGGLRSVELCGFVEMVNTMYLQRQNPDDPCLIEQSVDGGIIWTEAWRMDNCNDCDDNPTRIVDGIIEESPDGGITWSPIDNDPRFIGLKLPPRAEGEAKCNSAESTIIMMKDHFEQLVDDVVGGASVTAIIAGLIALLAIVVSLGTLTPIILPLAAAVFGAGGAAIDAALTPGVWSALKCLIFCYSEDDGSYTQEGWVELRVAIFTSPEITALARTLLYDYVTLLGSVGLSNAASYASGAIGDCSECECFGCSDKAFAGITITDFDHGSIVSRNPDGTITCELQPAGVAAGYLILRFDTLGDCCYINSFTQDSGASAGVAFIPCGVPYADGNYTVATPVGQCAQYAQWQGAPGAIITITMSECP